MSNRLIHQLTVMDSLILRSTVSTSSTTIYCNLSIFNHVNDTISSGLANFTDGNHIQIDFYDSGDGDDQNEEDLDETWVPNSTDWFYITISDCTDIGAIDLGETSVSEYGDFSSYQATPNVFLYQAYFRHIDQLLSDGPFDTIDLASRQISLCRQQAHDLVAEEVIYVSSISKIISKTEIFSDLSPLSCKPIYGATKANGNQVASSGNCSERGKITEGCVYEMQLLGFEAFLCVLVLLLIVSVISGMKKIVTSFSCNGNFGFRSLNGESQNCGDVFVSHNDDVQNTVTSTDHQQQDKIRKPTAAEEYYSMIENARESINTDYASWDHDTESESELSTINDVTNNRSRSARSDILQHSIDSVNEVPEFKISEKFVNIVEASSNRGSRRAKDAPVSMSVDLVELAFLAGD
jgi:hypothetical protein